MTLSAELSWRFVPLVVAMVSCQAPVTAAEGPRGIHHAQPVLDSPMLLASGMAWSAHGLVIADRKQKRLLVLRPSGKFEALHNLTNPFGVVFDAEGRLLASEKIDANRILRFRGDGKADVLVDAAEAKSPHALAVHKNGTLYWTGFPDGGTRSRSPDGKVTIHEPHIVHTFGIALAPKQDWLYVTSKIPDKPRRGVWRFPVGEDGTLGKGRPYFFLKDLKPTLPGLPAAKDGDDSLVGWIGRVQGRAIDSFGNFYIAGAESHTSGEAIAVISPNGKEVRAMVLGGPRNVASLALSGDGKTLYIAGAGEYRLHQVQLDIKAAN
jgi:sugar lactone lactonase YvrE